MTGPWWGYGQHLAQTPRLDGPLGPWWGLGALTCFVVYGVVTAFTLSAVSGLVAAVSGALFVICMTGWADPPREGDNT